MIMTSLLASQFEEIAPCKQGGVIFLAPLPAVDESSPDSLARWNPQTGPLDYIRRENIFERLSTAISQTMPVEAIAVATYQDLSGRFHTAVLVPGSPFLAGLGLSIAADIWSESLLGVRNCPAVFNRNEWPRIVSVFFSAQNPWMIDREVRLFPTT